MVNPAIQSAIDAMSVDERYELLEYIESTGDAAEIDVSDEQKSTIRLRAAELEADPSIGLSRDEFWARVHEQRA